MKKHKSISNLKMFKISPFSYDIIEDPMNINEAVIN